MAARVRHAGRRGCMMQKKNGAGHLAALFTIVVWGTTFISTKVLLRDFQPVEILVIRFVIGYLLLLAAKPGWVLSLIHI